MQIRSDTQLSRPTMTLVVAGIMLMLFLALPWALAISRAVGLPAWTYGAEPMIGWLRLWALLPVWLLLGAFAALSWTIVRKGA